MAAPGNLNMTADHGHVSPPDKRRFEADGYYLLKSLLTPEEARTYRHKINRALDLPEEDLDTQAIGRGTRSLADGVTKTADFWPLKFNHRLVETVRELLGGEIRYTQHSDLQINLHGGRYHRDSACREFGDAPDWDETEVPYKVVRVAIYLSDYRDSGSAVIVLPGSHRRESALNRLEYVAWNKLRSLARRHGRNDLLPHLFLSARKVKFKTEPGDCIIFDQRLMHAGGVLRGPKPKYAVFLAYGFDNRHSRNHRAFFLKRPTYSPEISPELRRRLAARNLLLD